MSKQAPALPRICIVYTGVCLATEGNHGISSVRVNEGRSADQRMYANLSVDLSIEDDGLD
jgi:hypothetical protein